MARPCWLLTTRLTFHERSQPSQPVLERRLGRAAAEVQVIHPPEPVARRVPITQVEQRRARVLTHHHDTMSTIRVESKGLHLEGQLCRRCTGNVKSKVGPKTGGVASAMKGSMFSSDWTSRSMIPPCLTTPSA